MQEYSRRIIYRTPVTCLVQFLEHCCIKNTPTCSVIAAGVVCAPCCFSVQFKFVFIRTHMHAGPCVSTFLSCGLRRFTFFVKRTVSLPVVYIYTYTDAFVGKGLRWDCDLASSVQCPSQSQGRISEILNGEWLHLLKSGF